MKQTLQLRLGQHLTMTPQLQQAIRLLQLSALELRTEVQEALESNLMLELSDDTDTDSTPAAEVNGQSASQEQSLDLQKAEIPEELPVDSAWEDIYDNVPGTGFSQGDGSVRDYEPNGQTGESLREHLRWQMQLTTFSDTDVAIAETIIDSINDDGYLSASLEDMHESLTGDIEVGLDEFEAVLHQIQNFDPPGVAARDLRESLLLQLRQGTRCGSVHDKALLLLEQHFDLLGNRDFTQLKRRMKVQESELKEIIQVIQSLNPRPGGQITDKSPEYIVPDVFVRKHNGKWRVELNPENAPKLRINPHYASLIKQVKNSSDNTCLKNHLQEAKWFLKSLHSRNETLLKVASCIVERQRGFLEYGEEAMKALVLHDIAEEVGMHESTISRVTTKKYMRTPRGVFELKYFFSSHVNTADGGACSATAIRALIKKLIAAENNAKPLSDSKIADILGEQGINVARRTVAKYRESLAIPPSNERKSLA